MSEKLQHWIKISLISLIPTFLVWLPFFLRIPKLWTIPLPANGLATIVSNYDGPLYLVVAKTLYNKGEISTNFQFPLHAEYYTAHFPLFPVLIKVFGLIMNHPYAMLVVTLMSSVLAIYFFNKLIKDHAAAKESFFLTFLFAIFPARWLIVRSVGSADPLFVAAIIASVYYFKNKKYLLSGVWGAIATLTKSPGILLFVSYLLSFLLPVIKNKISFVKDGFMERLNLKKTYPLVLIPLALLLVFSIYFLRTGDFWAYFHSGDNIHLGFPPFQIFNYSAPWVGTSWIEEIIFIYLIGGVGLYRLFEKKEYEYAAFTGVFFFFIVFVAHRDLLRYFLPVVPFLYVGFSDVLIKKEIKFALCLILIPIYLFSLAFISQNMMPISNWAPFL